MKILKALGSLTLSLLILQASAQQDAPKGFATGNIVLADNSVINGLVKDNMRNDASVILLENGKEKIYNGIDLNAAEVNGNHFICIHGDFFKVVSNGKLGFLQKSSDASSKATYTGNEMAFISGTEGKPGDYFIYDNQNQDLKLVSKKNFQKVVSASFGGYSPAVEKARGAQENIALLKEAVDLYNGRKGE
jgi:hypothetical protein